MRFRGRGGRRRERGGDVFRRSLAERREVEDETPWFLTEGGDDLEIEAGRSARMGDAVRQPDDPAGGDGPPAVG